ncbi:MAG: BREX system ATP-binding domain-containing protein [Thermodesulfobacteriota bacterium]
MPEISQNAARILIKSLSRGVVRPGATKYFHRGHEKWLAAQLEELTEIEEDGGAVVHFVRGAYGEGKTHFLNHLEALAQERGWVTAHIESRKDMAELDRFETIYPKIMQKLRLSADSLESETDLSDDPARILLDRWAEKLLKEVGYEKRYITKPLEAEMRLFEILQDRVMRRNLPGDLQRVFCAYPRASLIGEVNIQNDLVAWFRGEERIIHVPSYLLSNPGSRVKAPGVDPLMVKPIAIRPIGKSTSNDVFRGVIWLLTTCGYKGLILSVDEIEMIARLKPSKRMDQALQTLREFVDNTDGDVGLQHVAIYFAATPIMFDDESYFRSYDALATRIEPVSDQVNWRSPVIDLEKTMLTVEDLKWVASRIRSIYGRAYGAEAAARFSDEDIKQTVIVVDKSRYRIAKPRLLCRVVVDQLDKLREGRPSQSLDQTVSQIATLLVKENE